MPPLATQKAQRSDLKWVGSRFDRIAWSYPLFERLFLVPKRARALAVERLAVEPGQRILSIGCGRGPMLPALSAKAGAHGYIVGVDLSARMLHFAERCVKTYRLTNVQLLRVNALDHDDGPYDAVLFGFSLSSFGDPYAVLEHAWKSIRPGGRLVILEGQLPPSLHRITTPLLPAIRWFLEHTVLGDPDMRPLQELEQLGVPYTVEFMRGRTYFVVTLRKPLTPKPDPAS